jgi:hypothetical protein
MKKITRTAQTVLLDQGVLLLLELLLTTQLRASPALVDLPMPEALGNYPILQFGVVLITFIVTCAGILGWKKGEKSTKDTSVEVNLGPQQPPVAELHFDGPIKGIFDALQDIKGRQLLFRLEIKDDVAALLSQSRNVIVDCIHDALRDSNAATENRVRDLTVNMNSLHERVDDLIKNQATIMERLSIKKTGRG